MPVNLNDIAFLNVNGADYRCIINGISKNDAVNLLQNTNLTEGRGVLKNRKIKKNLLPCTKWVKKL